MSIGESKGYEKKRVGGTRCRYVETIVANMSCQRIWRMEQHLYESKKRASAERKLVGGLGTIREQNGKAVKNQHQGKPV